jgi:hypothetical protein
MKCLCHHLTTASQLPFHRIAIAKFLLQVWTNSDKVSAITSAGKRAVVSSSDYWYLDWNKV